MPNPFDITTATNTVAIDNKREGVAVFTVKSNLRRRVHAAMQVTTQPPNAAQWLTILPADSGSDPANRRDFPIDSTQQIQVRIAVPADAPPGSYTLRLTVADEVNPDDNFSQSPDVQFTVREAPKAEPRTLPNWLIPAIVIVALVVVVLIGGVVVLSNRAEPTPTPTQPPSATVDVRPCVVTMTNAQFVYQQPDTIANTMFDQLQSGAQHTAVGKSADGAWWKLDYYDTWIQTSLFPNTATVTGNCVSLPAICLLAINGDVDTYSRPDLTLPSTRAHAGWQLVPVGKLADDSWWQVNYQQSSTWIPTNVFGTRAISSGDCDSLPVVPSP